MRQSSTSLMSEARKVRESYKQGSPAHQEPAEEEDDHKQFNNDDDGVVAESNSGPRYQMLVDKIKDQDRTINFQKAKIVALQTELEETIKSTGNVDGRIEDLEKLNKTLTEENKKLTEKINVSNVLQQKMKSQTTDLQARITQLEKTIVDQAKDIEANERDKRKAFQD